MDPEKVRQLKMKTTLEADLRIATWSMMLGAAVGMGVFLLTKVVARRTIHDVNILLRERFEVIS